MRTFLRRAGIYILHTVVCITVFALLLGLYWSVAYSISVHRRNRAEQMLRRLAAMDLATLNPAEVKQIAKQLGAKESCSEEICNYEFDDLFFFGDSWIMRTLGRTEWDYFGLRPWQVSVAVYKGRIDLDGMRADIALGWNRGFDMWSWRVVVVDTLSPEEFERFCTDVDAYPFTGAERQAKLAQDRDHGAVVTRPSLDMSGGGEALSVYLSSAAPVATRRAVFDIDLRCATARKACTDIFQLAPSLRPYYDRNYKSQ
jgi:hypothetical protein